VRLPLRSIDASLKDIDAQYPDLDPGPDIDAFEAQYPDLDQPPSPGSQPVFEPVFHPDLEPDPDPDPTIAQKSTYQKVYCCRRIRRKLPL
jgi:hypothetical protein